MQGMVRGVRLVFVLLVAGLTVGSADSWVRVPTPRTLFRYAHVIFAGTVTEHVDSAARFRVTEAFKGVAGGYVDVVGIKGWDFEDGQQYLIFANECGDGCLYTEPNSDTRRLECAQAIIEQLRAEKKGRRVASVYGMLWGPSHPMADVTVRLQAGTKSFETKTDERGVYAFQRLPEGRYKISADLPPNLEVRQEVLGSPVAQFDLPARSSWEQDIHAEPKGRISGRLLGPDGKQMRDAGVDLYLLEQYKAKSSLPVYRRDGRPSKPSQSFDYNHLSPGDYVLVFNSANLGQPDAPFPRTFYPNAADLESSQIIHLADGQQIMDADIQLGKPLPTRQITVRLVWNGSAPENFSPLHVIAVASAGMKPYTDLFTNSTCTLNLFPSVRYSIHAEAECRAGNPAAVSTDTVTVDGSDMSVSQVTLTLDKNDCVRK